MFGLTKGDDAKIVHEPFLDGDPGQVRGAYAIIKLANGEVLREWMGAADIEKTRAISKAPNSLMWTKFYGEGCRKTVLRRCAKAAPMAAEVEVVLRRDDEIEADEAPALARPKGLRGGLFLTELKTF
jgi:recombination protein RecT